MPSREFKRIVVAADGRNPACNRAAEEVISRLSRCGLPALPLQEAGVPQTGDLLVMLGGDGFLMHTLRDLGHPAVAVLGLNFGQVGFLMNDPSHVEDLERIVCERRFHATELPIIEARTENGEEEEVLSAINDFVLERLSGQTIRLDLYIEGVLLNRYSGDGLIVATAAGSTAYTLAAGGPVVHPDVPALIVTPVNAHRPIQFHSLQFPLVLPLECRISITVVEREERPTRLVADGTPVGSPKKVHIAFSKRRMHLLRTEDFNYVGSLVDKVIGRNTG